LKLKLDENLGNAARVALEKAGHDVSTVQVQNLEAVLDDELIHRCASEGRALVSLDLDFANPMRYNPADFAGIAVLRLPTQPSQAVIEQLIRTLIGGLDSEALAGRLWIVEVGRLRIHSDS
jgi:predicted nuclease of predicted toxin-antitoxin system